MAKNKISEFSTTPANNTDIGGIDIAEGCAPSGINNAIRELMAQLKDMITGLDGDNQVIGGNLTVTGTSSLTGAVSIEGAVTTANDITITSPNTLTGAVTGNVTGNVEGNLVSVSNTVNAVNLITGNTYIIATVGSTNWVDIGAASATVGVRFTKNSTTPTGTGTATTFTGRAVNVTGVVAIENGGTGATSFTQNAVILGNGTSAPTSVLPSTNGNFLRSTAGATVSAGSFVVGTQYTILSVGSTDFTLIGASANTVGVVFTASGVGSGDGTATTNTWTSVTYTNTPAALSTATGSAPSYSARAFVIFNGVNITNTAATYTQTGTTVTVTASAHGYSVGHRVGADRVTGTAVDGLYEITAATTDTLTYTAGTSLSTTGSMNLRTLTISASGNILNVAYDASGVYGINFATAMPSANYACTANCNSPSGAGNAGVMITRSNSLVMNPTSRSQVIFTRTDAGSAFDAEIVSAVIFA